MSAELLQRACAELAARCDYAHDEDGVGFNSTDTGFGHDLAQTPAERWTPKMAAAAYKMLRKYKRQLAGYGVDFDAIPEPKVEEEHLTTTVTFCAADAIFLVRLPYSAAAARAALKDRVPGRRWDPERTLWTVPASSAPALRALAEEYGFAVDADAEAALAEAPRGAAAPLVEPTAPRVFLDGETFVAEFPFDRDALAAVKAIPGRKFDAPSKRWTLGRSMTVDLARAFERLRDEHGFEIAADVAAAIDEASARSEANLEASRTAEADIDLPAGLAAVLRPFQKAGVAYALANERTFIADQPGLGKSLQALATIETASAFPAIIVCPATLKLTWRNECARWLPLRRVAILRGRARPNIIESLNRFRALDTEIRYYGSKDDFDIPTSAHVPTILDLAGEGTPASRMPQVSKTAERCDPIHERFIGIVDDDGPGDMASPRRHDAAFSVDNSGEISEVGSRARRQVDGVIRSMAGVKGNSVIHQELAQMHLADAKRSGDLMPSPSGIEIPSSTFCISPRQVTAGPRQETVASLERESRAFKAIDELCARDPECGSSAALSRLAALKSERDRLKIIVGDLVHADLIILNYDIVESWLAALRTRAPLAVVLDESHFCKSYRAKRTKACARLCDGVRYRLLLTGTPIMNRPQELIAQLQVMDRLNDFGGFWKFASRFCSAYHDRFGLNLSGASNLPELSEKLRATCCVRRMKADVLSELSPKQRVVMPIELDDRTAYEKAEADVIRWYAERKAESEEFLASIADLSSEARKQAKRERADSAEKRAKQAEGLVRIEALKQLAARHKLKAVGEWIESFVETGQKLVVFASHREVQNALLRVVPNAVRIHGDDDAEARQAAVDRFQTDPDCPVIVCSLAAGGVGITLTAASDVAIVELPWTPAALEQAIDRTHRIGQRESVTAWFLLAARTVDEDISELLDAKQAVVDAAVDGTEEAGFSILDELANRMIERTTHGG